jgi:hypothetical protein
MSAGRYKSGREPFEVIEIDQDFCDNIYGASPCQAVLYAGISKCYNTIGTCQDVANYDGTVLTLRFCTDTPNMPRDGKAYFPFLSGSPKVKPAEINPGGAKRTSTALGKRATITVKFNDAPWSDKVVDPYQAERVSGAAQFDGVGYDPVERSTFWRKWKARNLYYLNRSMRYISGYVENGQIVDAVTRHFIITGFSGPDKNGGVTIEGQDVLYLAQRQKAEVPRANSGKLVSGISSSDTSFSLNPVGVGDEQYPASGWGRFGSEVIEYTRSGDTFTVVNRGQYGTLAAAHDAGDSFQSCWVVDSKRPDQILFELLNEYSEIDASLLDTTQWAAEALDFLPNLYSGIVTEPTSVSDIIAELCEQMYFYVWFDERLNKVLIRSVRPAADETVYNIDEGSNIISGSVSVKDEPEQVITRVVINYAPADPTQGLDEVSNYRVTDIYGDLIEEGQDRNRGSRTKVINSRWLQGGSAAAAEALGERLLARYKVPPRVITWQMDAKDRDAWVADFANITTFQIADQNGLNVPVPCQILSASEAQAGTTFSYTAQQFIFELPTAPNVRPLTQAVDRNDLVIRDWYNEVYGDEPNSSTIVNVTIRPLVVIGSSSTSTPAMQIGSWPSGAQILITIQSGAYIVGRGGNGGAAEQPGLAGGLALNVDYPVSIENFGVIGGGGGGGGGSRPVFGGPGGGGAGRDPGLAGGTGATSGSVETGGAGARRKGEDGGGGNGGNLGQPGMDAFGSTTDEPGGAAGGAITGSANITWINRGDVRGSEV